MAKASSTSPRTDKRHDSIWVFESNSAEQHSVGAALIAAKRHGAETGVSSGLSGASYALLTRDAQGALLPWQEIDGHAKEFRRRAEDNPGLKFRILPSEIAKSDEEHRRMADLMRNLPANCELPGRMLEILGKLQIVRIILLDANIAIVDSEGRKRALQQYFSANEGLWAAEQIEIVSFGAAQSIVSNDKYAKERGFTHRIVNVDTEIYGDDSVDVREMLSIAYATKLLCINDPEGTSLATKVNAISIAEAAGLEVDGVLIR